MSDYQGDSNRRKESRRADDPAYSDIGVVGDRMADVAEAMNRVADAMIEKTAAEGEETRARVAALDRNVSRLDAKVHFVRIVAVAAVVIAFASCLGIGGLLYRSVNVSGPQIADQGEVLAVIKDCINPEGECYRRNQATSDKRTAAAVAAISTQLRCDLGIECPPGVTPSQQPPSASSTTVPSAP